MLQWPSLDVSTRGWADSPRGRPPRMQTPWRLTLSGGIPTRPFSYLEADTPSEADPPSEEDPLVDRQTLLKTLPSLGVDKNNDNLCVTTSTIVSIFSQFVLLSQRRKKNNEKNNDIHKSYKCVYGCYINKHF